MTNPMDIVMRAGAARCYYAYGVVVDVAGSGENFQRRDLRTM